MDILTDLNPAQREAVTIVEGPVLVLAGPGSGKTRVLTHRVAYLVRECGIPPYRIMAVTFTNKAAHEMRARLHTLLGPQVRRLTLGTFHAICARILRREGERLGIPSDYVIYDSSDQRSLVRQALKDLNLDDKTYRPQAIHGAISRLKNELIPPDKFQTQTYWQEIVRRVYARYQELLGENDALDFDDLLMRTVQLFRDHPEVLQKYQRRYAHILVDEWQDTNTAQYELVRLLGNEHRNVFVVGDEDQSIYRFRGADYRNVQRFRQDFPEARVVLLEQSYRSPQVILDVANAIISHNTRRQPKRLWTARQGGVPVTIYEAYNEIEEAQFVVREIARLVREGLARPGDCAVMYRTNAQSRALEEAFMRQGMPYKLVGATRFYARREIKDILAYLRLIHNPEDRVSLRRVINVPPRKLGSKTVARLVTWAMEQGISEYAALQRLREVEESPFGTLARKRLLAFLDLLEELRATSRQVGVLDLLDLVLERTGYERYIRDGTEEGEDRWENIKELRTVAAEYEGLAPPEALTTFLEEVALVSDVDNLDAEADVPTLLTLHSAKGLEFPVVFIVGMEEGLLPHSRSFDDPEAMEEERRLCYVGITRAKERLYLVYAFRRTIYGYSEVSEPSRYLADIPPHLVAGAEPWKPGAESRKEEEIFAPGERVRHPTFGEGIVVECKPVSGDQELTVAFEGNGLKRLLASMARLTKL